MNIKRVKSIKRHKKEMVYDLNVEKNSNYIVSETILHNCDYRNEIKVVLYNAGKREFNIFKGDRIAQMVIQPVLRIPFEEVEELSETERGLGGMGSTGIK